MTNHGIQNEAADIRVHVCPRARMIYTFKVSALVEELQKLVDEGKAKLRVAQYHGRNSGTGYVIKPEDIPSLVAVHIPRLDKFFPQFETLKTTSEKGRLGEEIVATLLMHGQIPYVGRCDVYDSEREEQLRGIDLWAIEKCGKETSVEVKADVPGGSPELCIGRKKPTGNLYIQISEINYDKRH